MKFHSFHLVNKFLVLSAVYSRSGCISISHLMDSDMESNAPPSDELSPDMSIIGSHSGINDVILPIRLLIFRQFLAILMGLHVSHCTTPYRHIKSLIDADEIRFLHINDDIWIIISTICFNLLIWHSQPCYFRLSNQLKFMTLRSLRSTASKFVYINAIYAVHERSSTLHTHPSIIMIIIAPAAFNNLPCIHNENRAFIQIL